MSAIQIQLPPPFLYTCTKQSRINEDKQICIYNIEREHERQTDRQTYQWHIIHGVDNDALVLSSVLSDASKTRLHYVIAIEELLFSGRLHPHLELTQSLTPTLVHLP